MRWSGERKIWIVYTILAITIIVGVVFASGCLNFLSSSGVSKPGTQTTTPPVGTPPPPTDGGGGSGSTCDCDRHAFVKELKSDIDDPIDSVEYHLAETLTTSCFHLISHKASIGGEPLKPTNPQPEEYYFNANFAKNLGGTFNKYGTEYKSRLTINLFFNGNPEELVKTLTTDGTNNDWNAHNNLMFDNKDAVINQIKPIDAFLKDYERMPVVASIKLPQDEVNAGETIDIPVEYLVDDKGRSPQPFQRVLVKAELGKILGGTQAGEYMVFKPGSSSFTFQYKAPDNCDKGSSDTITIYNSCDISDKTQPLSSTTPKKQIVKKTINVKCEIQSYLDINGYCRIGNEITGHEVWINGKIPFTLIKTGGVEQFADNGSLDQKSNYWWEKGDREECYWTFHGPMRFAVQASNQSFFYGISDSGIFGMSPYEEFINPSGSKSVNQERPGCRIPNSVNSNRILTDAVSDNCFGNLVDKILFRDGYEIYNKINMGPFSYKEYKITVHLKK
jgi:hypothetical protein